jgi:hypothetical protein
MDLRKPSWVVEGIDLDRPNPARIYDYLLGGHHNFAADRAVAEKLIERIPETREAVVSTRAFVRRAVAMLTAEGIDQFLDIGSGLPTVGNVHDLAKAAIPEAHIVYVDVDPVVIAHSSEMLKDDPSVTIVEADVRYPASILEHEATVDLLDFTRPVGLMMTSLLHFVVDDDLAYRSARTLIDALPSGSYVAISHALIDDESEEVMGKMREDYRSAANSRARRREAIVGFFDGLELVEPGLVRAPLWRPEAPDDLLLDQPTLVRALVGVGRKA